MSKKIMFLVIAILAQFAIILYTTISSSRIINGGDVLKLRLQGYDPYDMFRGNYIRIRLRDDKIEGGYAVAEEGYVFFERCEEGYDVPVGVVYEPARGTIKVRMRYDEETQEICICYPFDKVWKNQEECEDMERDIAIALGEERGVYALVAVKDGEGRIVDIEIEEREDEIFSY